jgi:hypothetical protein
MAQSMSSQPEFAAAIRGYDRMQVDDYIERLSNLLAEAEERVRTAENDLEFSRHATVGPRVSEIFNLAVAESQELRDRIQIESNALLVDARQRAEQSTKAAREDAAELVAEAEQERDDLLADMERQRGGARERVAALEERRSQLLGELKRLRDALGDAAAIVEVDDGAETRELEVDGRGEDDSESDGEAGRVAQAS